MTRQEEQALYQLGARQGRARATTLANSGWARRLRERRTRRRGNSRIHLRTRRGQYAPLVTRARTRLRDDQPIVSTAAELLLRVRRLSLRFPSPPQRLLPLGSSLLFAIKDFGNLWILCETKRGLRIFGTPGLPRGSFGDA